MTTPTQKASTPRRGRPRDPERQRRVLDAARQHFYTHGYDGASLDSIALEAGVSKMTVYSYYPSKEALFEAVVSSRTDQVIGELRGSKDLDPRRPDESLRKIGAQFQELIRDEVTLGRFRALFAASSTQPEACLGFYKQGPERLINDVAKYLHAANEEGTLRVPQPKLAADVFLSMFLGGTHLHAMLGLGVPAPAVEKQLLTEAVRVFTAAYARR